MTLSLITNAVLAALVLLAIPGMLAWAIRTSATRTRPVVVRSGARCRTRAFPAPDSAPVTVAAQAGEGRFEMLADLL